MRDASLLRRAVFSLLTLFTLAACSSFNDPDDDPNLCQNGRHPRPDGQCPIPFALATHHVIAADRQR